MKLSEKFKTRALNEITRIMNSDPYIAEGGQAEFCRIYGVNTSIGNRLKKGDHIKVIGDEKLLELAIKLGIKQDDLEWKTARTTVFNEIESSLVICKEHSTGKILVDKCGIGKTYCAKYFARTMENCFYIDLSQCKTPILLAKKLALEVQVPSNGQLNSIKTRIKDKLTALDRPVIILDEAGDMNIRLVAEIKEYYNAVDGYCGWYLMGADGLRNKLERGINGGVVGYAELFSRMSDKFQTITASDDKFFLTLIKQVLKVNLPQELQPRLNIIAKMCLPANKDDFQSSGLRRINVILREELRNYEQSING